MRRLPDTLRHLAAACAALALLGAGVWVGVHGGLWSQTQSGRVVLPSRVVAVIRVILEALPTLALVAVAAAGLGWPLRRWLAPEARHGRLIQLGAGLALLLGLDWFLVGTGLLNSYSAWGLGAVGLILLTWQTGGAGRPLIPDVASWPNPPWPLLLGLPILGLYTVACACPPGALWTAVGGLDVPARNLELPREWLLKGHMTGMPYNVYSYLPNLVEAGFAQVLVLRGGLIQFVYTAQLIQMTLALLTGACVASVVSRWSGRAAGMAAAVCLLALPWVLVTGTLAADGMTALALSAVALVVLFDPGCQNRRGAFLMGLLIGASILADPTLGLGLIAPFLLIVALRLHVPVPLPSADPRTLPRRGLVFVAAAGIFLAVAPDLVRNTLWTGNPVFPYATRLLGQAHWSDDSVARWDRSQFPHISAAQSLDHLAGRWLLSHGFGAVGRTEDASSVPDSPIDPQLDHPGGLPVFWLAVFISAGGSILDPKSRRPALAMSLLLAGQLLVWLWCTPQTGRLAIPTVLPGAVLLGLGLGKLQQRIWTYGPVVFRGVIIFLAAALGLGALTYFFTQSNPDRPMPYLVDSLQPTILPQQFEAGRFSGKYLTFGDHVLNHLPDIRKVLLVGDASWLLYIQGNPREHRAIAYSSAFDANPLGDLIREHGTDPDILARELRSAGFSHIWINWQELARMLSTTGYDPDVTPYRLVDLVRAWRTRQHQRGIDCEKYRTPPASAQFPWPAAALYEIP